MHVDHDAPFNDPDAAPSAELTAKLGVVVAPELLELALTHRSFAFEKGGLPHNERLEWLGDSILGEAVSVMLFGEHPDLDESQLGRRRIALVSTVSLAEIARGIGLGEYIHLGRGERLTGGRDKESILADTMEAVIGAAYLSGGHETARDLVLRLVEPLKGQAERFGVSMDPKTALQELVDEVGGGTPPAYFVEGSGPQHGRVFHATVIVGRAAAGPGTGNRAATGKPADADAGTGTGTSTAADPRHATELVRGQGEGRSKRQAEMAAALAAWKTLAARRDATGTSRTSLAGE